MSSCNRCFRLKKKCTPLGQANLGLGHIGRQVTEALAALLANPAGPLRRCFELSEEGVEATNRIGKGVEALTEQVAGVR